MPILHYEELALFAGEGKRGTYAGVEARLPLRPEALATVDSLHPSDSSFRPNAHGPGLLGRQLPSETHMVICVLRTLISLSSAPVACFRSIGRWEEQLASHPASLPRGVCLFPPPCCPTSSGNNRTV